MIPPVSIPKAARFQKTKKLLTYDINYDSPHLKPNMVKAGGVIESTNRMPIKFGQRLAEEEPPTEAMRNAHNKSRERHGEFATQRPYTPMRHPPTLSFPSRVVEKPRFDDSCYSGIKKELAIDISPAVINKIVRSNMFGKLLTIPRAHRTSPLRTKIAERYKPLMEKSDGLKSDSLDDSRFSKIAIRPRTSA